MSLPDLATLDDVKNAFGRALTPDEAARAPAILTKASELFRLHSGQQFTPGESEVELLAHAGQVYLVQRPVTEVLSVTTVSGSRVAHRRVGQWLKDVACRTVVVHYSHGSDEVPDLVVTTIAEVCKKVLSVPKGAQQGVAQQSATTGPVTDSITYAGWAQGGQTGLAPEDKAIAVSFRPRIPRAWTQRARS